MSLIRNTAWNALAAVTMSVGRFALTILLANRLNLYEFGRFAFTQWLVDFAFVCLAFGLNGSASRFFAVYAERPVDLRLLQRWFFVRWAGVLALVAIAAPLATLAFGQGLSARQMAFQSAWAIAAGASALLSARGQGLKQFRRIALSSLGFTLVAVTGAIALPPDGSASLDSAMLIVLLATLGSVAIQWSPLPEPSTASATPSHGINSSELWQFSTNMWIAGLVSSIIWSRGELAVVKAAMGSAEVAQYSAALSLSSIAITGTMLLTGGVSPHLTGMWGAGDVLGAALLSRRITDMLLLASGVLSSFLIALAPEIVSVAFGENYEPAVLSLRILALSTLGLSSSASNLLAQLQSNARFNRSLSVVGAIGLLGLSFALVSWLGIAGASWARSSVAILVGVATLVYGFLRVEEQSVTWRNVIATGTLVGLFFALVLLIPLDLAARVATCSGVWLLLCLSIRDAQARTTTAKQMFDRIWTLVTQQEVRL